MPKLKRLDRIMKINNESTLNMPLDDAVKRLRGKPGSKVTIWVHRDGNDGWQGSRPFELTREEIRINSVDYRSLQPGIGYVRLTQFNTAGTLSSFKLPDLVPSDILGGSGPVSSALERTYGATRAAGAF